MGEKRSLAPRQKKSAVARPASAKTARGVPPPLPGTDLFSSVFQRAPFMMAISEMSDGTYLEVNDRFVELTGYSRQEAIGRTSVELGVVRAADRRRLLAYLQSNERIAGLELTLHDRNGKALDTLVTGERVTVDGKPRLLSIVQDISARKRVEREREATIELLQLVNGEGDLRALLQALTGFLQKWSGCEAVGIRLRDGDDFPYYETRGFPPAFMEAERRLCAPDGAGRLPRDGAGNPLLDCMCGNVLQGRFDGAKPFFTARGSFWSNNTTALLASSTEADRQARTRNRCNGEGYESVALVALRRGAATLGLLQLNDRRPNRFSTDFIALLERLADQLAIAVEQRQTAAGLRASEGRYRRLVESIQDVIFHTDAAGTVAYVSPAVERIAGYRVDELVGRAFWTLIYDEDREPLQRRWRELIDGDVRPFEYRIRGRDGAPVWVRSLSSVVRSDGGEVLGITGILSDISERKQVEQALYDSERKYEALFREMITGCSLQQIIVDDQGQPVDYVTLDVNPAFERILGVRKADVVGTRASAILPPAELASWVGLFGGVALNGEPVHYEQASPHNHKSFSGVAFCPNPGQFAVMFEDITTRRQAETELRLIRERLELAVHGGDLGVYVTDLPSGEITVNDRYMGILGYAPGEVKLTFPIFQNMIHCDDRSAMESLIAAILAGESLEIDCEYRMSHKSGEWIWIHDRGKVVERDDTGRPLRVAGTHLDITARRKAEEALRQSENRWRSLVQTIPDYVALHDRDGNFLFLNHYANGFSETDVLGKNAFDFIAADSLADYRETFARAIATGKTQFLEYRAPGNGATVHHYDSYFVPLFENGLLVGILVLARDISERKQMEAEHARLQEHLFQADKMATLGILVAGVAHEINNPNNFIMLNADIVGRAWDDIRPILEKYEREHGDLWLAGLPFGQVRDRFSALIAGLQDGARRIQAIVADLKEYAVPDPSAMQDSVDVNSVLRSAVHLTRNMVQKSTTYFRLHLGDNLPAVRGSSQKLEQVFINLIQNACQALTGSQQEIALTSAADGAGGVRVAVGDRGRGILPEDLIHLTDPFFTTRRAHGGTGLGLSICQRIVADHNGTMTFHSPPEGGTVVTVRLPGAPVSEPESAP